MKKLVFRFNNKYKPSSNNDKKILGGKGANLSLMAKLGLPVPPGFTISTEVCEYFSCGLNDEYVAAFVTMLQEICRR